MKSIKEHAEELWSDGKVRNPSHINRLQSTPTAADIAEARKEGKEDPPFSVTKGKKAPDTDGEKRRADFKREITRFQQSRNGV